MYEQLLILYGICQILRKSKQSQNTNSHAWIAQNLTVSNLQNLYIVHRLYGAYRNCLNWRNEPLIISQCQDAANWIELTQWLQLWTTFHRKQDHLSSTIKGLKRVFTVFLNSSTHHKLLLYLLLYYTTRVASEISNSHKSNRTMQIWVARIASQSS